MESANYRTDLSEKKTEITPKKKNTKNSLFRWFVILLFFIGGFILFDNTTPPTAFVPDTLIEIPEGYSLMAISKLLVANNIIRSPLYFSLSVSHTGREKNIAAGYYLFKQPESVFAVARRMASGDHGIETRRITLPEGLTSKEMSMIIAKELPQFDPMQFQNETHDKEGYLFPDTYFFFTVATSGAVRTALEDNFFKKTDALHQDALQGDKNWNDILTMASIIEGEAVTKEDRYIVSGILWNRIKNNMRLQVDAPFAYILGKGSLQLTLDDLKSDSPYNTYRSFGLPPTPINNPGLEAIDAALHPATTTYMFYLSDKNGTMHYAKTFSEHKQNKAKYLR